jgi:23S rRNA (cytosine1962-C5)-methyltransferase
MSKKIVLKEGRERSVNRKHPWIFSGAIASADEGIGSGETIDILTAEQRSCARAAFSPKSQIRARAWTFCPDEAIDDPFIRMRLEQSRRVREALAVPEQSNAYRLVNAEADGLPGLVVDKYADYLVCQFTSAGAEHWRETIIRSLVEDFGPKGIYERSDVESREKEGLRKNKGLIWGEEPPELIKIRETDLEFLVDVRNGHKTGFYLDQRENRTALLSFCGGAEILNCFAYTGAFGLSALKAGAKHVTNIESSAKIVETGRQNITQNGIEESMCAFLGQDVFQKLRQYRSSHHQFDIIILDPPKFIDAKGHLNKGARAYKDINLLAFKLLRPGGYLVTFSCSGLLPRDLFQKIVADAAVDAERDALIVRQLKQSVDHTIRLSFPEGDYLKGMICKVL